ncbi:MAG: FIG00450153: hypothetical protein, partial [uncultured Quadrisphaera sp.]
AGGARRAPPGGHHAGRRGTGGEPAGPARPGGLPPVRRVLRRVVADVLPGGRPADGAAGRGARRGGRGAVRHDVGAVPAVGAHPPDGRRRARARRGLQPRGARGRAVPHPVAAADRRGGGQRGAGGRRV